MFSIQKLIGGDEIFFELLEKSADEARESVQLLVRLLAAPSANSLDDFALLRKKDKRITEEISERLTTTFVTPLEREDIEALSNALYKIPKTLEKFGERLLLCPERVRRVDFSRQAGLLERAADVVLMAIDIVIEGEERFDGMRVIKVPIQDALKDPKAVFKRLEA